MYAATGGPNMKWGGPDFKWGNWAPLASVERIGDFCDPNPAQYFQCVIQSDPNPVALSKYLIQSGLYPKKLWLSIRLQWSTQFGYPYPIRWRYFRNPVQPGSGSELQNPVGSRSGNWIMFNTATGPPLATALCQVQR